MASRETSRVARARRIARLHGIYAIVNEGERDPAALTRAVLAAGVRIVQYRAKNGIVADTLRAMREATDAVDALLIVNDDWRAAVVFDCDGVHLGPDDDGYTTLPRVRAVLEDRLIGLSCGTPGEAMAANGCDIDYVGAGAVFPTASKADAGEPIGIDGLRAVAGVARVPVAAIGGITPENLGSVRASGVAMAAVISAISSASDPGAAAARLVRAWASVHA